VGDRVKVFWPATKTVEASWCVCPPSSHCPNLSIRETFSHRFHGICVDKQSELRTANRTSQRYKVQYDDGQVRCTPTLSSESPALALDAPVLVVGRVGLRVEGDDPIRAHRRTDHA